MHTGPLDVFHDAGDEHILTIADGVHFQLDAHKVFVDEHRVFDLVGQDDAHVFFDVLVAEGDDHILSAQHIGRPHEHRIAQAAGGVQGFLFCHHRQALGTADV